MKWRHKPHGTWRVVRVPVIYQTLHTAGGKQMETRMFCFSNIRQRWQPGGWFGYHWCDMEWDD